MICGNKISWIELNWSRYSCFLLPVRIQYHKMSRTYLRMIILSASYLSSIESLKTALNYKLGWPTFHKPSRQFNQVPLIQFRKWHPLNCFPLSTKCEADRKTDKVYFKLTSALLENPIRLSKYQIFTIQAMLRKRQNQFFEALVSLEYWPRKSHFPSGHI